jgi:hypothetical protein
MYEDSCKIKAILTSRGIFHLFEDLVAALYQDRFSKNIEHISLGFFGGETAQEFKIRIKIKPDNKLTLLKIIFGKNIYFKFLSLF